MVKAAIFRGIARDLLVVALAALMVVVGFVPAKAVAPLGNSTFLAQTQTQNLSGLNGAATTAYMAQNARLNGLVYFIAVSPTAGAELWVTDGTAGGTSIVKDIYPGTSGYTTNLISSNGKLFMQSQSNLTVANGGSNSTYEPYVSDGTAAGTVLLKDVNPNSSSYPYMFTQGPNGLTYFLANDGTAVTTGNGTTSIDSGYELWVTDGVVGGTGTHKVKDISTTTWLNTANSSWQNIYTSDVNYLTACNGLMFFRANDGWNNYELWVTDGTEANTRMVKDINTTTSSAPYAFYSAALGSVQPAGTQASQTSNPTNLKCAGNTLYFSADDGTGPTLWTSDGTAAGTVKMRSSVDGSIPTSPTNLIALGNKVIFSATANNYGSPATSYGAELWVSDGTTNGTVMLKDINPAGNSSSPNSFVIYNGSAYFSAIDSRGAELWKTDGTTIGTLFVKDINTTASGASSSPNNFYVFNSKLYFVASDGVLGRELYVTSGTGVSTVLVKDIFVGISDMIDTSNVTSNQPFFASTSNKLLFAANSPIYGQEMWTSDGTDAGTQLLLDINTNPGYAYAHDATAFNGKIYFSAASAYFGQELWSTDLTTGNTQMVIDIYPGAASGMLSTTSYFQIYNGKLYFTARNATSGWEIFSTDGTAAGTTLVNDFYPGVGVNSTSWQYQPSFLTSCNGKLFFGDYSSGGIYGLFAYDGSTITAMSNLSLYPQYTVCYNNAVYFQAYDPTVGNYDYEVWRSTGTSASTAKFYDAWNSTYSSNGNTYQQSSYPLAFTVAGGKLYFVANNATNGQELYVSDGTTTSVVDIYSGVSGSGPTALVAHQGALWFRANNGTNGNDLMSYDGSTLTARDIVAGASGPNWSTSTGVVSAGGLLWIQATFGSLGSELATTDGTVANSGTFEDLSPGANSTSMQYIQGAGNVILYNTYDSVMGSQPRFVVASSVNTVTFDVNGAMGGAAPADISVMSVSATVPGNTGALTKAGFNFTGWNTSATGTGTTYLPGSTITPIVNTPLYAMWASTTGYTITYNANNATSGVVAPPLTNVTSMINLDTNSGVLARTGYSFGGWNTLANGGGTNYASGARYTPTANVTLYATWTALTSYAISFNLNGATGTVPATINTYATATITLPGIGSMVAPAGKTFAGWNTNAAGNGTAYASAETLSPQSAMTLYAQWTGAASSVLSYNSNGATSGTTPSSLTAAGTYVVIDSNTGALAKSGFVFSGWNTAADGSGTTYQGTDNYLLSANVTLYAYWVAANYTVTFAGNGSTGGTVPAAITGVSVSTTLPSNTGNLVKAGYTFDGWNTLASGLGTSYATGATFSPTSSVTLYAKWTALPTYTITYSGNGATSGGVPVAQAGIYASVVLDNNSGVLAKSGFYFAGWNTQADGLGITYSAGSTFTPTANITMYALWSNVQTFTITYFGNSNTSGTVPLPQTGITSSAVVSSNTGSLARLGYRFDGWNTAANGSGTAYAAAASITPTADTSLYAQWVSVPTYTVTFNGNGQTSGSTPGAITSSDANVTLPGNTGVLNNTGYTFNGWNTAANGTGTHYDVAAAYPLTANVTLYAEWLGNIYTLTYNANGATAGTVPSPTSGRGALVAASNSGALAKAGYTFSGWNTAGDGTGTSIAAGGTYTPGANVTLFAKWTALPTYSVTFNVNGATSGSAPATITGVYASTTLPGNTGNMALAARVFGGWNTLSNGTGTSYAAGATLTPSANVTLYAIWNVNYSITYDANGATSGTVPATQTGLAGNATVASNTGSLALTAYNFAGWNTLANGTGTSYAAGATINSSSDVVLYAKWTLIPTYSVTYDVNGATSGSAPATQTGIVSAVTIAGNTGSLARTGYAFSGWNVQANGLGTSYSANTNISISANLTLYARWIAVYSITYDANGATAGTVPAAQTGITGSATISGNTGSLALTGSNFAGWNTQANGLGTNYAAGASVSPSSDIVLYAKWTLVPTYSVTYLDNGATSGSAPMSAQGVVSSTQVDGNLGSMVKTGFTFAGWNTQADGLGTTYLAGTSISLTNNVILYAMWTPVQAPAALPAFSIKSVAKRQFDLAGGTQTINGVNLNLVTYVALDGERLTIISASYSTMTFVITKHAAGWATLVMKGDGAVLTFTNFVQFVGGKTLTVSNFFTKGSTKITDAQVAKLALTILRAREYKVLQLSFGDNLSGASQGASTITLKDNITLMKLAMRLMQLFPKTVDVTVRLTGNTKDLTLTFNNS